MLNHIKGHSEYARHEWSLRKMRSSVPSEKLPEVKNNYAIQDAESGTNPLLKLCFSAPQGGANGPGPHHLDV